MQKDILTKILAEKRASNISNIHYNLLINLKENSKAFQGECEISFNLKRKEELRIDFFGKIKSLKINNLSLKFKKEEFFLIIKKESLQKGENKIKINYTTPYSHTGDGLHKFTDIEDKSEYIYSNFEPYSAHLMFPCFDQPDLKATYQLTVNSPKKWEIVSNTKIRQSKINKKEKITEFNKTQKFSSYLFHLSAGPYHSFKNKYKNIDLKIYCRKSMKNYIPKKDIFDITKKGLEFYEEYFNFKYPFEKYDQLYVPEFNSGAMENVGAVTFTEKLLRRRPLIKTEKLSLANVILHEMVHMWFGNLVTMKWWNDLWLNESFADFLSYIGMSKALNLEETWSEFYNRKYWAYYQDQLPTTHPVANKAQNTEEAFASFDGISYAKGASVLKQLMFYIGEENFKKGLQFYFKKHQWQNTTLNDFKSSLEKASKKKLNSWFKQWIFTKGVDTIYSSIKTKKDKIKNLKIIQTPSLNNKPKTHRTKISFHYKNKTLSFPVVYSKRKTKIKQAKNKQAPEFIYLNNEDYDYVKTTLNKESIQYVSNNFNKIKKPLDKQMILGSLYEMIRDSLINPKTFLKITEIYSLNEKDLITLESLISNSLKILNHKVNDQNFKEYCKTLNALSLKALQSKIIKTDNKTYWLSLFLYTSQSTNQEELLTKILNNKIKFPNLKIDQDKRWTIINTLAVNQNKNISAITKKELKKDSTDKGKKASARSEVSLLKNKEKYWKLFTEKNNHSLDFLRETMSSFYNKSQKQNLKAYPNKFFKQVEKIFNSRNLTYSTAFFMNLFPRIFIGEKTIKLSTNLLKKKNLHPLLRKYLTEEIHEMKKNLNIIKKFS